MSRDAALLTFFLTLILDIEGDQYVFIPEGIADDPLPFVKA
jgi:hypothetical protein